MDLDKNMVYSGREKNPSEGVSWGLENLREAFQWS